LSTISIIIPVLNEETTIGTLLESISGRMADKGKCEVIIIDGGSTDRTENIVGEKSLKFNFPVVFRSSEKGRAVQMNMGASVAAGAILYFLHADSLPPQGFDNAIRKAVTGGEPAGCFRLRFDARHPLLRFSQWFTRFNWKICRGGDQSLFVSRELFGQLGGFDERYRVYEDCEFINRLYLKGHFTVLKGEVLTSARKYRANGTWRLQYHFTLIHIKKWLGSEPEELYRYYQRHIAR
jgi:rSAM/selenodomain-associated transferase 2